jgi:hypothetical protein
MTSPMSEKPQPDADHVVQSLSRQLAEQALRIAMLESQLAQVLDVEHPDDTATE